MTQGQSGEPLVGGRGHKPEGETPVDKGLYCGFCKKERLWQGQQV